MDSNPIIRSCGWRLPIIRSCGWRLHMLIQTVGAGRGQRVAFLDQSTRVFYVDFDNLLRQRVHWLGRNTDSEPESQIRWISSCSASRLPIMNEIHLMIFFFPFYPSLSQSHADEGSMTVWVETSSPLFTSRGSFIYPRYLYHFSEDPAVETLFDSLRFTSDESQTEKE